MANHVTRGELPAESVIAIAVAYGLHPVGALVETGYLDPKYAQQIDPMFALRTVTDEQVADEVLRRMLDGREHRAFETPVGDLQDEDDFDRTNLHLRGVAHDSPREDDNGRDESMWHA
ncbi:hypothetical protein [Rhodococcus jostii]